MNAFGWNELDALGSLLGGTFTTLAFAGTLWILVREGRQIRDANQRRDAERRDDERRQARLVFASLAQGQEPRSGMVDDADRVAGAGSDAELSVLDGEGRSAVYVRVFNHSSEPIWDVKVPIPGGREQLPLLYERVDPQSSELNGWLDAPPDWYLMHVGAGCPGTPNWIPLDVTFVDNAGRRWRRSGRGEPVRLSAAEDNHPLFDGL
ncbi:hypothetical protein [Micromonospora sp. NBC_01813]|uniref:hypothetical protein n=1 Tax=Micromonospora sp. NBC_01813 TaxID=2975988 RepID=UPI002DD82E69|nr:hypothetical protein [Micromonospora sp. NBC_01813]WSA11060.1 hypothetical protein OG958_09980 [Micromonospora sp. NBC_01813]